MAIATNLTTPQICVNMADEGIPVQAIARSVKIPSEQIRECLRDAVESGALALVPRNDWPVKSSREDRSPSEASFSMLSDDSMELLCMRAFKLTRLMSTIFSILVRRREVTRETMHQIIEQRRRQGREETDQKMVDVVVCNLRKRLKPFDMTIKTIWGTGYYMSAEDRRRATEIIVRHAGSTDAETPQVPAVE